MSYSLIGVSLVALAALIVMAWRRLYPTPYPGIPYNKESAGRIAGDIPDLVPVIQKTNEFSESVFTVTTQKLGKPIAQMLFPGIRNPLIILEDPREIENVVFRRNREFDKAPMALDLFSPMFCRATLSQYTTPELKAQKRLWADVMSAEFLHRVAAPRIYKATLELLDLWRLKATTSYKDQAFHVMEDFQNAALDAIWVAIVGEEPGMTRHEMKKLRNQLSGDNAAGGNGDPPRGAFLKEEVSYISETIGRNSNSPFPKWAQKLETWTPRYRRFRRTIASEVGRVMKTAVDRFLRAGNGRQEADELDTCMLDMVLRRQVIEANKAKRPMTDPTQDQSMLDEMFVFLFAGHDSTANVLSWFVKYMEAFPDVQTKLRSALRNAFSTSQPGVKEILETDIPYLDATCEEGFRLAGVAKANLRSATVDTEILGCHVPKGAQIMMNYHINRSPVPVEESKRTSGARAAAVKFGDGLHSRAGHDIARFEPRRWLVKDKTTGREVFDPHAIPSLAFGGGYRGCTGRKLAYVEFRIVVALLILNLEFQELPQELKSMRGNEKILRKPDFPYAKLRAL